MKRAPGGRAWGGRARDGVLVNGAAVALAVLLFAFSFPSAPFPRGLPFLAWAAYAPLFWVIGHSGVGLCVLWGALYGSLSYAVFNYWLNAFHPLAGFLVSAVYLVYMAALFPCLKLAVILMPRRGYIVQWLLWIGYEYLRTLGFLGYPYGITGYSQWAMVPLIQIASVFGVWAVSALVVFPSAWIGAALGEWIPRGSRGMTGGGRHSAL